MANLKQMFKKAQKKFSRKPKQPVPDKDHDTGIDNALDDDIEIASSDELQIHIPEKQIDDQSKDTSSDLFTSNDKDKSSDVSTDKDQPKVEAKSDTKSKDSSMSTNDFVTQQLLADMGKKDILAESYNKVGKADDMNKMLTAMRDHDKLEPELEKQSKEQESELTANFLNNSNVSKPKMEVSKEDDATVTKSTDLKNKNGEKVAQLDKETNKETGKDNFNVPKSIEPGEAKTIMLRVRDENGKPMQDEKNEKGDITKAAPRMSFSYDKSGELINAHTPQGVDKGAQMPVDKEQMKSLQMLASSNRERSGDKQLQKANQMNVDTSAKLKDSFSKSRTALKDVKEKADGLQKALESGTASKNAGKHLESLEKGSSKGPAGKKTQQTKGPQVG